MIANPNQPSCPAGLRDIEFSIIPVGAINWQVCASYERAIDRELLCPECADCKYNTESIRSRIEGFTRETAVDTLD